MNKNKKNNKFGTVEVVFVAVATCLISLIFGMCISGSFTLNNKNINNANSKEMDEIIKFYNEITNSYYGDIDKDAIVRGAKKGMIDALGDDYSSFIDDTESDNFNITLEGNYEGLGVEIAESVDNKIYILRIFKDSPAEKAGLKVGDVILSIDNLSSPELTSSDFSDYVRNGNKKSFNIKVLRNEEEKEIIVNREKVIINSVSSKLIEKEAKKIGYIYVEIFAANTYEQFKSSLENLESQNIDSLIIDLRDNTGGHLSSVANMLSLFVDSKHVIYQTEDDTGVKKFYSTGKENKKYPIYILVNNNSASASEIMTGTLKDELNVTIIGKTTYGKGSVQELRTLKDGTQYKITVKKWLTSGGKSIDKVGITPDYDIDMSDEYYKNPTDENDSQLNKAIELIQKGN